MSFDERQTEDNPPAKPALTISTLALYARHRCFSQMSGAEYLQRSTLFDQSLPAGSHLDRFAAAARQMAADPNPINFFLGIIWMDSHGFGNKSTLDLAEYFDLSRLNF